MRIIQDEMIQITIMMEFHLDWPGYRTTDLLGLAEVSDVLTDSPS